MNTNDEDLDRRLRLADPMFGEGRSTLTIGDIRNAASTFDGVKVRGFDPGRRSHRTTMIRVAVIAAAMVALAALTWPTTERSTPQTNVAYAVAGERGGPVNLSLDMVLLNKSNDLAGLQRTLRTAGLPAVVMRQTADCAGPPPDGLPAINDVYHPTDTTDAGDSRLFTFQPAAMPQGSVFVVVFPATWAGPDNMWGVSFIVLKSPPSCAPITFFSPTDTRPSWIAPSDWPYPPTTAAAPPSVQPTS